MAQFYGTLKGSTPRSVTRTGTKRSGLRATADGYEIGGTIYAGNSRDGDVLSFYVDHGTNGDGSERLLATIREGMSDHEIATALREAADRIDEG